MSESSVIKQLKDLRKELDKESKLLNEQMELQWNGAAVTNDGLDNNSIQLNNRFACAIWVIKYSTQIAVVDPYYI